MSLREKWHGIWSRPRSSQQRKIVAVYLDPDNFKNIGDGHTIADQINEVLEPYDLAAIPASSDRMGSSQLMYQMLQKGFDSRWCHAMKLVGSQLVRS